MHPPILDGSVSKAVLTRVPCWWKLLARCELFARMLQSRPANSARPSPRLSKSPSSPASVGQDDSHAWARPALSEGQAQEGETLLAAQPRKGADRVAVRRHFDHGLATRNPAHLEGLSFAANRAVRTEVAVIRTVMFCSIPESLKIPRIPLLTVRTSDSTVGMIHRGSWTPIAQGLDRIGRDGSTARRLARRANALVLLDDGIRCEAIAEVLLLDDDTTSPTTSGPR